VIVRAYNSERYIGKALDSVLAQSYAGLVDIIVPYDRGTADGTARVLGAYGDVKVPNRSVTAVEHEHTTPFRALQIGLERALEGPSDYMGFLESDNAMDGAYLERAIEAASPTATNSIRYLPRGGVAMGFLESDNAMDGAYLERAIEAASPTATNSIRYLPRGGAAMWRWGACASFSISFRLNMSRARIILQLPSSGWSEMELNVTVPWRWSRSPGLIRPTPPGVPGRGICARRPKVIGIPARPSASSARPKLHLIHYGVLPVEPGIAGKHRAARARAARAPQTRIYMAGMDS